VFTLARQVHLCRVFFCQFPITVPPGIQNTVAIVMTGTPVPNVFERANSGMQGKGGFAAVYATQLTPAATASSSLTPAAEPEVKGGLKGSSHLKDTDPINPVVAPNPAQTTPVVLSQIPTPTPIMLAEPPQIVLSALEPADVLSPPVHVEDNSVNAPSVDSSPGTSRVTAAIVSVVPLAIASSSNSILSVSALSSTEAQPAVSSLLLPSQQTQSISPQAATVAASSRNSIGENFLFPAAENQSPSEISENGKISTPFAVPLAPPAGVSFSTPVPSQPANAQDAEDASSALNASGAQSPDIMPPIDLNLVVGTMPTVNAESDSAGTPNETANTTGSVKGPLVRTLPESVSQDTVSAISLAAPLIEAQQIEPKAPVHTISAASAHISEKPTPHDMADLISALNFTTADTPIRFVSGLRENPPLSQAPTPHPSQSASLSPSLSPSASSTASQTTAPPILQATTPAQAGTANQAAASSGVTAPNAPVSKEAQSTKQDVDTQNPSVQKIPATSSAQPDAPQTPSTPTAIVIADSVMPVSTNQPGTSVSAPLPNRDSNHPTNAPDSPSSLPQTTELPAPLPASPVQMAQMVSKAAQSEMRIGLNTSAFGSVEVHTVIHANDVGVLIGSEKGDLRSLLANELPGIANTLQQQNLRLSQVNFHHGFSFSNPMHSGAGSQSRSFTPRTLGARQNDASNSEFQETPESSDIVPRAGLSILA
jgi:Flagellar hook-length control protein FliK